MRRPAAFGPFVALLALLPAATLAQGRPAAPAPAAGTLHLYPERIPLASGGLADAERGVMFVPVNRTKPDAAVISLEVYRFKSTNPAPGVPPIFYLYGGPSFEGLEPLLARRGYYEQRLRPLRDTADLVIVSQRGIGPSKPTTLIQLPPPAPPDQPQAREARVAAIRASAEREKQYWLDRGLDLRGFTIVEAAADIDDVRKALGYDKVTLWGGSFGSHWGMAVMRFHPEIVERAILRGMEGPDHTYDMPSYVLHSLERLAAEADAAPALAGLIPPGGLLEGFKGVIARTAAQPVVVEAKDPATGEMAKVRFGPEDVRDLAEGYTAAASSRGGMRTWAADMIRLVRGDFTAAAEARLRVRAAERFRTASYYMLDCGSGVSPARRRQIEGDPAVEVIGPLGFNYFAACPVWDVDLGDEFRKNFDTQIPTVIVQGDYDISTPLENAQELAPHFKRSRFIVVHGGSHPALDDAMDASTEFARAILAFARGGDMGGLPASVTLPPIDWVVPRVAGAAARP